MWNGYMHFLSGDYITVDFSDIVNIYKYLTKEHDETCS